MTYAQLAWDIASIVIYNLPLIIFSIIGFLFAIKRNPTIWFILGLVLMLLSYIGGYRLLTNVNTNSFSFQTIEHQRSQFVYEVIFTFIYFGITLYLALKIYHKNKMPPKSKHSANVYQTNDQPDTRLYCPFCGAKIYSDHKYCGKCGSSLSNDHPSDTNNNTLYNDILETRSRTNNNSISKSLDAEGKKSIRLWLIWMPIILFVICLLSYGILKEIDKQHPILHFHSIKEEDIDTIKGVPDFYNLEWGMSPNEVQTIIPLEAELITETDDNGYETKTIGKGYGKLPKVLGMQTVGFWCIFYQDKLTQVQIAYSLDDYSKDRIIAAYKKRYGEDNDTQSWNGKYTELYFKEENGNLYAIYDGSYITGRYLEAIDPLLLTDYIGYNIDDVLDGLTEGTDYKVNKYDTYKKYTVNIGSDYFDLASNSVLLEFDVDPCTNKVNVITYLLFFDNATPSSNHDTIRMIYDFISSYCGVHEGCICFSLNPDNPFFYELSKEEMFKQILAAKEGSYSSRWTDDKYNTTLIYDLQPNEEASIAHVSIGKNNKAMNTIEQSIGKANKK